MTKWVFTIFIAIGVILAILFVRFIVVPTNEYTEEQDDTQYTNHVQIIVKSSGEYFWQQFQEGANSAGTDHGIYVEFVQQSLMTDEELQRLLESGAYAKVDGIALQPLDLEKTSAAVEAITVEGVQVATYESGSPLLLDVPTVGSNYLSTGTMAGQMALEAAGENAKVVVLLNKSSADEDAQLQNTMIQGIMDSAADTEGFEIMEVITIDPDKFEAESVTQDLLAFNIETSEFDSDEEETTMEILQQVPDVIICLDEKSTPAVAQALVDNGYVGQVTLIGYGAMPQTLDYINRGVIFGSVFPDAYETGYKTVELLRNMIDGRQVSDYSNPELHRIDQSNVDQYIALQSEE